MRHYYWRWNDNYYLSDIRLGMNFQVLDSGSQEYPKLYIENEILHAIVYKESIPLINFDMWKYEKEKLISSLNDCLAPLSEPTNGDVLIVIFRDFFISQVILKRLTKNIH